MKHPQYSIQEDRIYPETRWTAAVVVPFLIAAFLMLYLFPERTGELFAWPVKPPMMPMLMGAGYLAGAYFFIRVMFEPSWRRVKSGFLPVATFAGLSGLATLLHWDRFTHTHISFIAWAGLYFTTPFVIFILWLRNRRVDPGQVEPEIFLPTAARVLLGGAGLVFLVTAVLLFTSPGLLIPLWPWELTPLNSRVLASWFALPGVLGLVIASDPRWRAARLVLESQALGILLILIGAWRAWPSLDAANPLLYLFLGTLALLLVGILALHRTMEARRRDTARVGI